MKINASKKSFLKDHKEVLAEFFKSRIEDLKEEMIMEENSEERNKIIEAIRENKRWLQDIEVATSDKKVKEDTGI